MKSDNSKSTAEKVLANGIMNTAMAYAICSNPSATPGTTDARRDYEADDEGNYTHCPYVADCFMEDMKKQGLDTLVGKIGDSPPANMSGCTRTDWQNCKKYQKSQKEEK